MKVIIGLMHEYYDFIERHWGDYVGLLLIFTGVGMVSTGGFIELSTGKELHVIYAQGGGLITTGVGLLKLRGNPKADTVEKVETTTTTQTVVPPKGD
jgi:hypothetical protein